MEYNSFQKTALARLEELAGSSRRLTVPLGYAGDDTPPTTWPELWPGGFCEGWAWRPGRESLDALDIALTRRRQKKADGGTEFIELWTQGQHFDFQPGTIFYDPPIGPGELWSEKNVPDRKGLRVSSVNGDVVEYELRAWNNGVFGVVSTHRTTQAGFVRVLITGEME